MSLTTSSSIKDNENIIARFFSQSDEGKKQQQQSNEFDNLKQYQR
ncbi:hypothetical protein [Francisella tularensis]|nr:hypothetical protein [Francisella tularensis]